VLTAGGDAGKVVFSGVGKRVDEMEAALEAGIHCFNVESEAELIRLNQVAGRLGKVAPISFRVNPDVDPKTHPYISTGLKQNKFGIAYSEALARYRQAAALPHIRVTGVDCHIGSQLTDLGPIAEALDKILVLVDQLADEGIVLSHIDVGGGLGVRYRDETPPAIADYASVLLERMKGRPQHLVVEPGRSLVANAGLLLSRVEYLKHGEEKTFAIIDAAMNDLMRPALYDAWHEIEPVTLRQGASRLYEIVGPVCETGDFLARERELDIQSNDLVALLSAGAYGMSMSSNYNSRPRAAEVLVTGSHVELVRERERMEDLMRGEHVPQ
jgi:diaminopimelate decarboxylase